MKICKKFSSNLHRPGCPRKWRRIPSHCDFNLHRQRLNLSEPEHSNIPAKRQWRNVSAAAWQQWRHVSAAVHSNKSIQIPKFSSEWWPIVFQFMKHEQTFIPGVFTWVFTWDRFRKFKGTEGTFANAWRSHLNSRCGRRYHFTQTLEFWHRLNISQDSMYVILAANWTAY